MRVAGASASISLVVVAREINGLDVNLLVSAAAILLIARICRPSHSLVARILVLLVVDEEIGV